MRPRPLTNEPTLRARLTVDVTKKLNTDGTYSSKLTEINVEFNVPRVVNSTLCASLSRSNNIQRHNKEIPGETLLPTAPPLKHHTLVINRPLRTCLKPHGTLGGCLKLKKRSAWLFGHSLQNQQTDDKWHNMCAHHLVTKVFRDDPRRLGTTSRDLS